MKILKIILMMLLMFWGFILVQTDRVFSQAANDPEYNFEFLWKTFDRCYALFQAKHIDWQALYNIYRPQVNAKTSEEELFVIMSRMLGHLNDNHVRLTSTSPERFFSAGYLWDIFEKKDIATLRARLRQRPVPDKWFKAPLKESENKIFAHGWLTDTVGYLHFFAFGDAEGSAKAIDEILAEFMDAQAIIVDVRHNGGGDDRIGKLIADRFADRKRLYMTTQDRNGPGHGDFDPKKHFFVEPGGPRQFTKTVILLTNRLSISAAENFALAMRILPHITVVGDFTSGCFADNYNVRLPIGWNMSLSKNLFLDQKGFCWEGIGVPPDIRISNHFGYDYDKANPESDPVLETALALIQRGDLRPQDESENSSPNESLANLLENQLVNKGIDTATNEFKQRMASYPDGIHYLDFFEMEELISKLYTSGHTVEGEKVLSLTLGYFPDISSIYSSLGLGYLKKNQKKLSLAALEKAIHLKKKKISPLAYQFREYLAESLIAAFLSGGSRNLDRCYRDLRNHYPQQMNEIMLNNLGYYCLFERLTEPAIELFKLNVKHFPRSANTYDSLGEAYMVAGNKKLAIRNYKQSLKLNPNNTNAIDMLKKLKSE